MTAPTNMPKKETVELIGSVTELEEEASLEKRTYSFVPFL